MMACDTLTYSIPGGRQAASEARAVVTEALATRLDDDRLADVRLLVSELVTNAVVHARSRAQLRLSLRSGRLRAEVEDRAPAVRPRRRSVGEDATNGRGLALVADLASSWGVTDTGPGGKAVWFELEVGATTGRPAQ